MDRLDHLRAYFCALGADMAAAGKFHAQGGSMASAAARAALAGACATAAQYAKDTGTVASEVGTAVALPAATHTAGALLAGYLGDAVGGPTGAAMAAAAPAAVAGAVELAKVALTDFFRGRARVKARRKAGKALMDAAARVKR